MNHRFISFGNNESNPMANAEASGKSPSDFVGNSKVSGNKSGVSTRRSACDECRFSKSKCLRQRPDQARCDRCCRSESECIISPIFRLRNWEPPSATNVSQAQEARDLGSDDTPNKKKRPRQSGGRLRTPSRNPSPMALFEGSESSLLHLQLHDSPSSSLNLSLGQGQQGAQIPTSESGEAMAGDWLRHWMPTSPQQVFSVNGASSNERLDDIMGGNHPHAFQFGAESESGLGAHASSYSFAAVSTSTSQPRLSSVDFDSSRPAYDRISATRNLGSSDVCQIHSRDDHGGCTSRNPSQRSDSLPQVDIPMQQRPTAASSEHPPSAGQTALQCLCRLDYELITMLARLDHDTPRLTMKRLVTVETGESGASVAHQILDKTTEFVQILEALVGGSPSLSSSTVNTPSSSSSPETTMTAPNTFHKNPKHMGHRRRAAPSPFSISDDDDGNDDDEDDRGSIGSSVTRREGISPVQRFHFRGTSASTRTASLSAEGTSSPTFSPSGIPPPPDLDVASLLSILVTYMRLVQLYLIVFAYVNDHLKDLSQSDSPEFRPISGLAFSSFPMQSGNLQTLILIQIVTNLFEKIDDLLALPKEFRMSKRRRQGALLIKKGILAQAPPGFMELARATLAQREDEEDDENARGRTHSVGNGSARGNATGQSNAPKGHGGMRALRRHIAETKQLLRENIAP